MWGFPVHFVWQGRIDAGELLGPRFVIGSPIVDGPNPVWPNSVVAADAAAGRDIVRRMKNEGYDSVKVYSRLPRDAYFAIAETAKELKIPFAGHVPGAVARRRGVRHQPEEHRTQHRHPARRFARRSAAP